MPLEEEEKKPEVPVKEAPKGKGQPAKVEKVEEVQAPPSTINITRFTLNESNLPTTLLGIEDERIQSIQERSASLFPDDNSVMRVDHFSVGGEMFSKSLVLKDNLKFGLRYRENLEKDEEAKGSDNEDDTDNGLVAYKPTGDTEFWLHFENGTKLVVEQVHVRRNP